MPFGDTPGLNAGIGRPDFMMPQGTQITSALSNKGNATGILQDNSFRVLDQQAVRIVDGSGKVLFSGSGPEAAKQAVAIGQELSNTQGNKASWNIQTGNNYLNTDGSGGTRWDVVANEKVNKNIALMALNAAVQIGVAVATSGMSIPAQAAISAGTSAALTLAEGGSITDAIKAGVMAAAPTLGAAYAGPLIQSGTSAAGKVVATTLGKTVAAGASSTAMGLITGQDFTQALLSGAVSAGGQLLAAKLAGAEPDAITEMLGDPEFASFAKDVGIYNLAEGSFNIDQAMGQISAGVHTAANVASGATANAAANTVSGIGGADPAIIVNAQNAVKSPSAPSIPTGAISGIANAIQQPIPASEEPETIVTAQEELPPRYEVDPAAPVITGISDVMSPDLLVTAQNEGAPVQEQEDLAIPITGIGDPDQIFVTAQEQAPAVKEQEDLSVPVTGIGSPDQIIVQAQNEAPPVKEREDLSVPITGIGSPDQIIVQAQNEAPPVKEQEDLSLNMTDIGDLISSDDFQKIVEEERADTKDEKSILDYVDEAATLVGAIAPLLGGGGGDDGGTGGGSYGPGITFNPIKLTPTVVAGVGSYDPNTYGRVGGNQETEYTFFTRSQANPAEALAAEVDPSKRNGFKEGGEMNDDMVKHLVEYRKGGGHQGPGKVTGIGSGQEDLIPAWLSDGEYVWSAQDVADLGDGSTAEGVRRLDKMRQMVRKQAGRRDVKKIAKPQKGIDTMLKAVGGQV